VCNSSNNYQMRAVYSSTYTPPAYFGGGAGYIPVPYVCNGSAWNPVGIDVNGNLNVPKDVRIMVR